jgi:hypothetical protein
MLVLAAAGAGLGVTISPAGRVLVDPAAAIFGAAGLAVLGLLLFSAMAVAVSRLAGLSEKDLSAPGEERRQHQRALLASPPDEYRFGVRSRPQEAIDGLRGRPDRASLAGLVIVVLLAAAIGLLGPGLFRP